MDFEMMKTVSHLCRCFVSRCADTVGGHCEQYSGD